MRKSGVIVGLLVVLLVVSSVSFVSAGLLTDFWDKITGQVVSDGYIEICTAQELDNVRNNLAIILTLLND